MLFPEEHAPHLKKWIVKRLENTSDADADVLADYVLALLRHDGDANDVRKLCEEEIPDFLREDSSVFVNDVFEAIAYQSYLPGAPPPPSKHAQLLAPAAQPPPSLYYDDTVMGRAPAYQPPYQNGSRKRAYKDWDEPNAQNGRTTFKHPRRGSLGGRGPRQDDFNNSRGPAPAPLFDYSRSTQLPLHGGPPPPATVGYFDANSAAGAMFGMSLAAGRPMPELLPHGQRPPRRRAKCRDWESKGFCQRGSNCMFDHSSDDPVFPPLPGAPFGGMQPVPPPAAFEEYDPNNALMPALFNGPGPLQGQQQPLPEFSPHRRQKGGRHQRRGPRAPFSADGAVFDRTKSTVVVENIPEENFSEEQVRDFFSQFGNIVEVSMQPYKRLAIVRFDSWASANAAYKSPKVIFDNRFVRVFWYKDDESALPASARLNEGVAGPRNMRPASGSPSAGANNASPRPEIDMEEFARNQEEKQRAFEEKMRRRQELERQQQELENRQKELVTKQQEEKAKLEAKLARRDSSKSGEGEDGKDGEPKPSKPSKPRTQTEALRAQLAALEAEARQMGLDPDAAADAPAPWSARGGSYEYGRGRGGWRGSAYTPRGYRGGYRGRANVHAAYAAYSLDNRPKKVVLTGVDFTVSEKDEILRQYLFGIGEFTDIKTTPASTEITFKDRKTAEKFFNSVVLHGSEIPGIDDCPVELAWAGAGANGSAPTTSGASTPTRTTTSALAAAANKRRDKMATMTTRSGAGAGVGGADGDDDDAAGSGSDKDVHILLERPADQNEMDYEVADESHWGY